MKLSKILCFVLLAALVLTLASCFGTPATQTYTVTFDSQGGSSVASVTVNANSTVAKPADPTKEGYTFKGWNNGSSAWNFSNPVTSNLTLVAQWEEIVEPTFTVTFDANGGSAVASITVDKDALITEPAAPTKEGYTFAGWKNGSKAWNFATDKVTSDITLKADWTAVSYTIKYYDGATELTNLKPADYTSEDGTVKLPTPTKDHYNFVGWYTSATPAEGELPVTNVDVSAGKDLVYYAQFDAKSYTLTFTGATVDPVKYTINDLPLTIDATAEKTGYTFAGWKLAGEIVTEITLDNIGNKTLTAAWNENTYNITYTVMGNNVEGLTPATFEYSVGVDRLPTYEVNGYTFNYWTLDGVKVTKIEVGTAKDIELVADLTPNTYNLTYKIGDVTVGSATFKNNEGITLDPAAEKAGYTFNGWTLNGEAVTAIPAEYANDAVVIGSYTAIKYTITYTNGETVTTATYTVEDTVTLPKLDDYKDTDGYTWHFMGWVDANDEIATVIAAGSTGDKAYTAKFEKLDASKTLTYYVDGVQYGEPVNYDSVKGTALQAAPTKVGYAFSGWTLNGVVVTEIPAGYGENAEVYGVFTEVWYSITYIGLNNEVLTLEPAKYMESNDPQSLPTYSLSGYKFEGWSIDNEKVSNIAANTTGDLVITAILTKMADEKSVTYVVDGTVFLEDKFDNEVGISEEELAEIALDASKLGYTFSGWKLNGTVVTSVAAGQDGDIELIATNTINNYTITYMDGTEAIEGLLPSTYTVLDIGMALPTYSKNLYEFAGWETADGTIIDEIYAGLTGDLVLTAKFNEVVYTITYYTYISDNNDQNVAEYRPASDSIPTLYNPENKEGYVFEGWYTTSNFAEGTLVEKLDTLLSGDEYDVVLYAKWSKAPNSFGSGSTTTPEVPM